MVRSQSFNKVLELKREKVIEIVHRICTKRNLPIPSVNFEGCEGEHEGQLAHYHPEINTICISERQLIKQDFEDLERTIAHEVSHILVQDHSPRFLEEETTSSIAGWKPPSGVVHITGDNQTKETSKIERKSKLDKVRCNYHLCKKKTRLTKCSHCKGYFCSEHLEPYEPKIENYPTYTKQIIGHPCVSFVDYLTNKKEQDDKRYSEALDRLLGRKRQNVYEDYSTNKPLSTKYPEYSPKSERIEDEMYIPSRKEHFTFGFSLRHFNIKNFLRRYVYFRIQENVKPHLNQFGLIFIIGIVLNYVYYQTLSLSYLFIGGVNQWFSVLLPTLNYGLGSGYNLFYLIINGIFYAYFYYSFVLVIYNTITNLDDRDTWVMFGWFVLIIWIVIKIFPQII